ncbi:HAD family phosphatase [Poseidonibacter lekithochrous]|uniref:HAD family hydrolase n=1 Tax=Poseidonibacter TaxID=2321187 RepID=UPI001C0A3360|nr:MULTISPECIES: HAD family phosphatase [Poseidonibacter]MBU3015185.1 HAD family phosphatase [Poseidonibacter lekithochrous]MDO6828482.1 HAD family phosphatase [Poseidonibacter sp. 1_MG-2023]
MIENKKYILFDNDGVLVETEPLYFEANVKALKELNIELSFDRYMKIMARGGTAWELAYEKGISKKIVDNKRFQRDIYYQELIKTRHIEIANVKEILKELSKKYKMAIITTSRREDFELIHKNRGIVDFMDFVLCVEDYPRAKPYPDPYLAGLKRFKASNDETIVIEDSQRGLISAVNAKIDCVIVKNDFTLTHDFSKASYRIDRLEELINLLS